MAIITYPLNNVEYNAEDAETYNCTRTSGVFAAEDFKATATGTDNNVTIGEGLAWIHDSRFTGKSVAMKESATLNLEAADTNFDRIDAIVLKFDTVENATSLIVKKGTAQSKPKAPLVVRSGSVYELHLYHVLRKVGQATIKMSDVSDLRGNSEYCGYMTDAVTEATSAVTQETIDAFVHLGMVLA